MTEQVVQDGKVVLLSGKKPLNNCNCIGGPCPCTLIDCETEYTCTTSNVFQGYYNASSGPDFVAVKLIGVIDCGDGDCDWIDSEAVYLVPWEADFNNGARYRLFLTGDNRNIEITWGDQPDPAVKTFFAIARDGTDTGGNYCFFFTTNDDPPVPLFFPDITQSGIISSVYDPISGCGDSFRGVTVQGIDGDICWNWCDCGTLR